MPWKRKKPDKTKDKYIRYNKRRKINKKVVNVKENKADKIDKKVINVKKNKADKRNKKVVNVNKNKADNIVKVTKQKPKEKAAGIAKEIKQTSSQLHNTVSRIHCLEEGLKYITRTEVSHNKHKACVCVICDSFIIGVEKICWLSVDQLISKDAYLSVKFVESTTGKKVPTGLRNQYKIKNCHNLSHLLLSPRAHVNNDEYMCCLQCFTNVTNKRFNKPPKFGITNGWLIGQIPESVIENEIEDVLAAFVA